MKALKIIAGVVVALMLLVSLIGVTNNLETSGEGGMSSSSTINGITFTIKGGGSQSISAVEGGAEIVVNNTRILAIGQDIRINGVPIQTDPYTHLTIDNRTTLQVLADDRLIYQPDAAETAKQNQAQALADQAINHYFGENGIQQDRAAAARLFEQAADIGHARSAFNLGIMYRDGDGVEQSGIQASTWFEQAAKTGLSDGYAEMAMLYWDGNLLAEDRTRAVSLARMSSSARGAALVLGNAYYLGAGGLTQDNVSAAEWYLRAAEAGSNVGAYNLGLMYRDGEGVARDVQQARTWLQTALDAGNENARPILAALSDSPATPTNEYFYAVDGAQTGPVSLEELRRRLQQGQLHPTTLVWKDGMANWQPLQTLTEFNGI